MIELFVLTRLVAGIANLALVASGQWCYLLIALPPLILLYILTPMSGWHRDSS